MKTLVIANQKGGVGKTSTLVHLAFYFAELGKRVAVIDLDSQANASWTLEDHDSGVASSALFTAAPLPPLNPEPGAIRLFSADPRLSDIEKSSIAEAAAAFRRRVSEIRDAGFDILLVDTAPSLGVAMAAALVAADYVLSPIELEAYSIQGIKRMVTTIANVRRSNPGLQFLGMMPSKVDGRNPRHRRHLAELRESYGEWMIPFSVGLRSSIADALATGVPVWRLKKTAARKASEEVKQVAAYVAAKMEVV